MPTFGSLARVALLSLAAGSISVRGSHYYDFLSGDQVPFTELMSDFEYHRFDTPIRTVAVIGAGPHGLLFASELLEANIRVRLFDRKSRPGGE